MDWCCIWDVKSRVVVLVFGGHLLWRTTIPWKTGGSSGYKIEDYLVGVGYIALISFLENTYIYSILVSFSFRWGWRDAMVASSCQYKIQETLWFESSHGPYNVVEFCSNYQLLFHWGVLKCVWECVASMELYKEADQATKQVKSQAGRITKQDRGYRIEHSSHHDADKLLPYLCALSCIGITCLWRLILRHKSPHWGIQFLPPSQECQLHDESIL
jgi:hypothetical protein